MNTNVTGRDKVKKICDLLKKETLDPAKEEALHIIAHAQKEAEQIIVLAEKKAAALVAEAKKEIEKREVAARSTLTQAYHQTIEFLRQALVKRLFNPELREYVQKGLKGEASAANLIQVIVKAIEAEGLSAPLQVYVSSEIRAEQVNALLGSAILQKLEGKTVRVSELGGGVEVKLQDKQMTIDLSDKAVEALLAQHLQMGFRKMLFAKDV